MGYHVLYRDAGSRSQILLTPLTSSLGKDAVALALTDSPASFGSEVELSDRCRFCVSCFWPSLGSTVARTRASLDIAFSCRCIVSPGILGWFRGPLRMA